MGTICLASLKGGVGKTSIAINVAHAFARRGCRTLLLDLDPTAHATHYFEPNVSGLVEENEATSLAKVFLGLRDSDPEYYCQCVAEQCAEGQLGLIHTVRSNLDLVPSSAELRYFYWGRGARTYCSLFAHFINELKNEYDHIVIDTSPDFNVLLRNAVAVADLVVVPVDSSAMSISCMEDIISCCAHIEGPSWSIVRTMVGKNAKKIQRLSQARLEKNISLTKDSLEGNKTMMASYGSLLVRSPNNDDQEAAFSHHDKNSLSADVQEGAETDKQSKEGTIYLLNSVVNRTEQQNKLSHIAKTAFDLRETAGLGNQYLTLAREIEELLGVVSKDAPLEDADEETEEDSEGSDMWFEDRLELSGV